MVTARLPVELPVQIGSHCYQVDARKYKRAFIPGLRQQFDTGSEPGARTLNAQGSWVRSGQDWLHGAGQEHYDHDTSDRQRFWHSDGQVSTQVQGRVCICPKPVANLATGGTPTNFEGFGPPITVAGPNVFYAWTGNTIVREVASTNSTATCTGGPSSGIFSLVYANGYVYVADSNHVFRCAYNSTAFAEVTNGGASIVGTLLGYANGHLLIGNGNKIDEIASTGVVTTRYTDSDSNAGTYAFAASPGGIYASILLGDGRSVIRVFTTLDPTTSLAPPVIAGTLSQGEVCYSMLCVGGDLLVLGTLFGVRVATIGSSGSLTIGPLIQPADLGTAGIAVTGLAQYGQYVFCAGDSLFVLDLGTFTEDLAPAWHYLFNVTSVAVAPLTSTTTSTSSGHDEIWVWDFNVAGDPIRRIVIPELDYSRPISTPQYYSSGLIDSGWISYGIPENKQPTTVVLQHEPLTAGTSITAELCNASGTVVWSGQANTTGATASTLTVDQTVVSPGSRWRLKFSLTSNIFAGQTATPVLTGWSMRAIPIVHRQEEIIVPVLLKRQVPQSTGRGAVGFDPLTELQYLRSLVAAGVPVSYTEGSNTAINVLVDDVNADADPDHMLTDDGASPAGNLFQGVVNVRLVTVA